jgi:hypothetical protein
MHAVVLLCPYSDSQSSELLSSDTSNPQHKTAHPHHHCLSTPSLPMTARKMIHSIPGPYSKSIIPPRITASAANACGSLLTPKSKAPRRSTVASLGIVREALPILASGNTAIFCHTDSRLHWRHVVAKLCKMETISFPLSAELRGILNSSTTPSKVVTSPS